MTQTCHVRQPETIPAVTHIDSTARIQTVDQARNPKFASLIESFYNITGVPLLLNTSFNDRDEPIVCTPADAIACFLATNLDALAIENHLILKQPTRRSGSHAIESKAVSWLPTRIQLWNLSQSITYPIRWFGSTIALAAVFYLLITPIGLWRRRRGHRPLHQIGWLPFTYPVTMRDNQASVNQASWWRELLQFLKDEKKWWLIPIAISLAIVAVAATVGGSVAPWIYALW